MSDAPDDRYFAEFANALQACTRYRPKFGQGRGSGLTVEQFRQLYHEDPFYNWIGLDSPLLYAAHKAAGGMTSIYRQIGIGVESIFRLVLQDSLGLSPAEARWTYQVPTSSGKTRTLYLDGRIQFDEIREPAARQRVRGWAEEASDRLLLDANQRALTRGVVFEVRQGYKSKDSKRQNADIANAANAYLNRYLPVLALSSAQIDGDVANRYTQARWLLLVGTLTGRPTDSTYSFCTEVLGYDLAGFFERNSPRLRAEVDQVLSFLLTP